MRILSDTQSIFAQLAAEEPAGVHVVIENHDAWVHADHVEFAVALATRLQQARLAKDPTRSARIEAQRQRLQSLVSRLPKRTANSA